VECDGVAGGAAWPLGRYKKHVTQAAQGSIQGMDARRVDTIVVRK